MNRHQLLGILNTYEDKFKEMNIEPIEADFDMIISGTPKSITLGHCHGMIPQMRKLIGKKGSLQYSLGDESDWEKVNRWLGFIQGVLWCDGIYSINQMRDQNR